MLAVDTDRTAAKTGKRKTIIIIKKKQLNNEVESRNARVLFFFFFVVRRKQWHRVPPHLLCLRHRQDNAPSSSSTVGRRHKNSQTRSASTTRVAPRDGVNKNTHYWPGYRYRGHVCEENVRFRYIFVLLQKKKCLNVQGEPYRSRIPENDLWLRTVEWKNGE